MSIFRFQQFTVIQKQSAMKVCTDAVLFGAMAPVSCGDKVLDIGAGTGLLSLMMAQLGAAQVTAVELTEQAYEEAQLNFANSPWTDHLVAVHQDIQSFSTAEKQQYDLIICNPPFFENHSKTTNSLRKIARHNDALSYADLLKSIGDLLAAEGLFYVLLPIPAVDKFIEMAVLAGFYLKYQTDFRGYDHNEAKVSALTLSRVEGFYVKRLLTIYEAHRVYRQESQVYLEPFLLRFAKAN